MSLPVIVKDIEDRLKVSGGNIDGNLFLNGSVSKYSSGDQNYIHFLKGNISQGYLGVNGENNPVFISADATTIYDLYGEHNKPAAADIGALPLTGGTLTGTVYGQWFYGTRFFGIDANGYSTMSIGPHINGTTSVVGEGVIEIGNNVAHGNNGNSRGRLRLFHVGTSYTDLMADNSAEGNLIYLPTSSGTLALTSNLNNYLPLTGGILDGKLIIRNEPDFLRSVVGNYGIIFRNDGSDTYILLTNSGNSLGTWNDLRPFCINNANGFVSISNGLGIAGGLQVSSEATITGPLKIGSDAYGNSKNYIAFYGTSGDDAGQFNHTYIGENLWATPEGSELILYKGNDVAPTATTYSSSGPDRIRHIAAAHLFQVYNSALSGSFATICTSTVPQNIFEINRDGAIVTGALKVSGAITSNNETVTTRAIQTSGNIPDITRLFTTFNNTITGYGISGDRVSGSYSFIITVKDIGTPFQLIIPDNGFHFTKRLCSNGTTYRMDFCSMSSTAPHTDMCWVY